ncbi:hypothetical protein BDP55DRAFT_660494 [Colletotrichum godetiae]|uniref:Uncharacterized protein n=1 Tax=Colletotrichum godetiae TaxID=1209918 RepID=A0AAJ0AMN9_9PEZI|nr:uncharacterized protein BDP55DRAFT_660494 [Colletotrichum godetiae]KAK1676699.1 hypothetical protein BDP55DRAFT_660494 [Colletotrichum godetiae]
MVTYPHNPYPYLEAILPKPCKTSWPPAVGRVPSPSNKELSAAKCMEETTGTST